VNARASNDSTFLKSFLNEQNLARVRALHQIADRRGQTLAQMAIAWVLRDKRVTTALIGARNVEQLNDSLDALNNLLFAPEELAEIDLHAQDGGLDRWKDARETMA
jgi:L-glyceraldehyde 3-phosphate reductase